MKLLDFLKIFDGVPLKVICYIGEDKVWSGNINDTPWWITLMKLDNKRYEEEGFRPVEYRVSLGENYDDKAGLIICLKDEE